MGNTFREQSKKDFTPPIGQMSGLTTEQLQLGCMQRIADATEVMAVNHNNLLEQLDRYKNMYKNAREREDKLTRSNQALRGVISRMKKKNKLSV